jgi:dipeptidyl aminopeptidase/acylaminoacyl peptidase
MTTSLLNALTSLLTNARRRNKVRTSQRSRRPSLGVELLEHRLMPSGSPITGVITSPDGLHTAQVVTIQGMEQVVENGKNAGPSFARISQLQFSPVGDHLAFIGSNAGNTSAQVIEDGKNVGSPFASVQDLLFSADGTEVAFIGLSASKTSAEVIENGSLVDQVFAGVSQLQFSPVGHNLAFVASSAGNTSAQVIENGKNVGGIFGSIQDLKFSPDGTELAFIGLSAGNTSAQVIENGKNVGGTFTSVTDLTFSPVGDHLAFVANNDQVFEDGHTVGGTFSEDGEGPSGIQFSSDGKHIAFVVPDGTVTVYFDDIVQLGVLTLNLGIMQLNEAGEAVVLDGKLVGGGPYEGVSFAFNAASTQLTVNGINSTPSGGTTTVVTTVAV